MERIIEIADGILELVAAEIGFRQAQLLALIEQRRPFSDKSSASISLGERRRGMFAAEPRERPRDIVIAERDRRPMSRMFGQHREMRRG